MDLHAPEIAIIFKQPDTPETNQSPATSAKRNRVPSVVDEILSIPTSKKNSIEEFFESKSRSSEEDSLGTFGESAIAIGPKLNQLRETVITLEMKNTEDHLEIFKHIEKAAEERKQNTEFNRQIREDIGSLKSKISNLEALCKILNDGLSAAHQSEALRNQKAVGAENKSKLAQQQLAELLQKTDTNADLYVGIQEQYNELKTQFDVLCAQLAKNPTPNPLLTTIMSMPRLHSARSHEDEKSNSSEITEITLEDILTQQQKEILEMGKMIQQLNNAPKEEQPDFHNIIETLRAQIVTAEKKTVAAESSNATVLRETKSLMRWAQGYMTVSVAALLASFWIWWQAHKA